MSLKNRKPSPSPSPQSGKTQEKKPKKWLVTALVLLFITASAAAGYFAYQNYQLKQDTETNQEASPASEPMVSMMPSPEPSLSPPPLASPSVLPSVNPGPSIPAGWQTYQNEQYGFAISYPDNYQALDDENNLYGWPKAVVLLYKGGQAYDMALEIWDNQSEYEDKYKNGSYKLTVKQIGNKYLTIVDFNENAEYADIVSTFRLL